MLAPTNMENVMSYDRETDTYLTAEERRALKKERSLAKSKAHAAAQTPALKPVSTAAGMKQRQQEFKQQLLSAPVATSIIRKVINIARNDEHPGQMAAMKMCMDRMLPVSVFEESKDTGRTAISITITGIGETRITGDTIEHDDNNG